MFKWKVNVSLVVLEQGNRTTVTFHKSIHKVFIADKQTDSG